VGTGKSVSPPQELQPSARKEKASRKRRLLKSMVGGEVRREGGLKTTAALYLLAKGETGRKTAIYPIDGYLETTNCKTPSTEL